MRPVLPLSAEVITKIRALRQIKKISGQALADRMTELGYPVGRSALANTEGGRVSSVSVDFVDTAARALGIDLVTLLTQPVACPTCKGEPPIGFSCNTCGVTAGVSS